MKKLSIFTIIMFALCLYMVPATFATGGRTDSKDATGGLTDSKDATGVRTDGKDATGGLTESKDKQYGQGEDQKVKKGQTQAQQGQQFELQKQNLMLVDKLIGTEIQNQQGEKIGEIDSVLVDVENGRVGFVTMTSGGIFGMGQDKYIVPFNALEKNMPQGKDAQVGERQQRQVVFTLNRQKDQLKVVPEGDIEDALTQEGQSRGIHEHYGVSPYWEDGQRQQQRQDGTQGQMMQETKKDQMMDKKDQQKNQKKY